MEDQEKNKTQLLNEVTELRRKVTELKELEKEHKNVEKELRRSEEHLSRLFETMVEGVVLVTADGQIVQANPAAELILGLRHYEIKSRNYIAPEWKVLRRDGTPMPPDEMAGPRAMKEKSIVKDVVMGVERPDTSVSWINVSASPIISKNGELEGVVVTFIDITKRNQAEEALRESEEKYRSLTENTSDWLWEVDQHSVYTYTSPKVKELLGYEPEEIIGKTPFDLMLPDEAKRLAEEFGAIAKAKKSFDRLENINLHKNGKRIVLETSGVPILDENEDLLGFKGIDRDITERKLIEEENMKLLEEKNIALRQVMEVTKLQKGEIESKILANVEELIMPILSKLKGKGSQLHIKYLELLENNLKTLTSSFGDNISRKMNKLTPKEIEICNMIRNGLTSKEISGVLNTSHQTVEKQRKIIRKKLGITDRTINLVSFLKNL